MSDAWPSACEGAAGHGLRNRTAGGRLTSTRARPPPARQCVAGSRANGQYAAGASSTTRTRTPGCRPANAWVAWGRQCRAADGIAATVTKPRCSAASSPSRNTALSRILSAARAQRFFQLFDAPAQRRLLNMQRFGRHAARAPVENVSAARRRRGSVIRTAAPQRPADLHRHRRRLTDDAHILSSCR